MFSGMRMTGLTLVGVLLAAPAPAKPPLANSQESPASVCIGYEDSYERLVDICREALETPGASVAQQLDMMDSLAWSLYGVDRTVEAQSMFEEMLALDASSPDAHAGLGWLAYDDGDYEGAADRFRTAMGRSPNARVLAGLGASQYYADAIGADEALMLLDSALAIDPDYGWAQRRRGWILADERRFDEAEAAFRTVIGQDPGDAAGLYGLAFVLSETDRWKEALPPVNRALEEAPEYGEALSRRSLIHYYLGNTRMALKDADAVIALHPDWSEGYVRKARALARLGKRQEALDLLESTDARIGDNSFIVYWLASLLLDDDQADAAMHVIGRNIARPEADFHDHLLMARIAIVQKNSATARSAIDKALAARPEDEWALFYGSLVLAAEGRFEEAEAGFDAAVTAGLPRNRLADFIKVLISDGQMVQAIRMRARYALSD